MMVTTSDRHRFRKFVLAGLLWLAALPAAADIYMYIDSQGILHFTNTPTSSNYKLYIKEKPRRPAQNHRTNRYDQYIHAASHKHGIAFSLLKALIKAESDFDPQAVSKSGAMGLMQIMPENVKAFNLSDPFDPRENIMAGAWYFQRLLQRFEGQLPLALAAYNAGPTVVEQYQRVPPIKETEDFVQKVMKYYNSYQ